MKVYLLSKDYLESMLWNTAHAALTCTGNEYKLPETNKRGLLAKLIDLGHESVLEHINLTFRIEDISRALLQELARHRHISMSVQSTRNTMKKTLNSESTVRLEYFSKGVVDILDKAADSLPEKAAATPKNKSTHALIHKAMSHVFDTLRLISKLDPDSEAYVPDFVKYLLPECIPTSLIITVNARELRHIFKLRSRPEALLEFRYLVKAMYDVIPIAYNCIFQDVLHEGVFSLPGSEKSEGTPDKEADSTDPDQPKA